MFFGSAVNNFGVREVLDALVDLAPSPGPRTAIQREVAPDEPKLSASSSRSRPTWTPRTATGSRSCASRRATSSAACG
jgi:translation elongation factor EF-G